MCRLGQGLLALSWLASLVSAQKLTSTPDNFRGFQLYPNGAIETITCSSSATFFTSSTYGACCIPGERCNFATACEGGTASRIFGGTYTCDSQFPNCYTMTVYASYPSASDSWLVRGCATNWKAFTIYREIVTATSKTSTPTPTTGPTAPAVTPPPTGTSAKPNPTSSATETPQPAPSQAWIAGAVIGPVVAVAGLGFLAFWLGMRRGKNKQESEGAPSMMQPGTSMADRASFHPSFHYSAGSPVSSSAAPFANINQDPAMTSTPSPPAVPGYPQSATGAYTPSHYQPPQQYPAQQQFAGQSPPQQYTAQYAGPEIQHSQFRDPYTPELDNSGVNPGMQPPPQHVQYPNNTPELDSGPGRR